MSLTALDDGELDGLNCLLSASFILCHDLVACCLGCTGDVSLYATTYPRKRG
jgi:hypothetical protein